MKVLELANAIAAELKASLPALEGRAFVVPSRLLVPPETTSPLALVVYRGGPVFYSKSVTTNRFKHLFEIYLVHAMWKEDEEMGPAVIIDATEGLLTLLRSAMDALKDKRFTDVDQSIVPELKQLLGTEDYWQIGWFGASAGFSIEYLEVES